MDIRKKEKIEKVTEFVINNKIHLAIKVFLFIVNYGRELRMRVDIRSKRKIEKMIEFAERIKKVQKEAIVMLKKAQDKMKQQANRERKEVKEQKKGDKVMLNTKDLVFKERLAKKLVE